jgi:hypothetical protein
MARHSIARLSTSLFMLFFFDNAYAMNFTVVKFKEAYDAALWTNEHGSIVPIYAEGKITEATGQKLKKFIEKNKITDGAMIILNSPGGSLIGGMTFGNVIREMKLDTGIGFFSNGKLLDNGICASACAYSFAGGVKRYYSGQRARLGIHQFYSNQSNPSQATSQKISGIIVAYLHKMGVDALVFSASTLVDADDMLWLTKEDAEQFRFSNNGAYPTTSELKQVGGFTYLKIEQNHISYSGRFMLGCVNRKTLLAGGLVSNPQSAKDIYGWATNSLFTFDAAQIQPQQKEKNLTGLTVSESVVWVTRDLPKVEVAKLLSARKLTVWIAADGAIGRTASADISRVGDKIKSYVVNCYQ